MAHSVARKEGWQDAATIIRHLHKLVTHGPWDLDIASAMSAYGYDAVKWAEGEMALAKLVSCDRPVESDLTGAIEWYIEAAAAAQNALIARPRLLAKLGVGGTLLH
jgi:hypothetical protein